MLGLRSIAPWLVFVLLSGSFLAAAANETGTPDQDGDCPGLRLSPGLNPSMEATGTNGVRIDLHWSPLGYPGEEPPSVALDVAGATGGIVAGFKFNPVKMASQTGSVILDVTTSHTPAGEYPLTVTGSFNDRGSECRSNTHVTIVVERASLDNTGDDAAPQAAHETPTNRVGNTTVTDGATGQAREDDAVRHGDTIETEDAPGARATLGDENNHVDLGPGTRAIALDVETLPGADGPTLKIKAPPGPLCGQAPLPSVCWNDEGLEDLQLGPIGLLVGGVQTKLSAHVLKHGIIFVVEGVLHFIHADEAGEESAEESTQESETNGPAAVVTREAAMFPHGTEFTVDIGDGTTTIQVISGTLFVVDRSAGAATTSTANWTVSAGHGLTVTSTGATELGSVDTPAWWEDTGAPADSGSAAGDQPAAPPESRPTPGAGLALLAAAAAIVALMRRR